MSAAVETEQDRTRSARIRPAAALLIDAVLGLQSPLPQEQTALDVESVVSAADMHRVTPAVYRRAAAAGNAPASWMDALAGMRRAQLARHLRASADLAPIARAFDDGGIRWAVAKGPAAADLIWPHPDMREYVDIDLFVHPTDFEDALATLERLGSRLVDRNWVEVRRCMRAELALVGATGTPVDLHWDMAVPPKLRRAFHTDMAGMLRRSRQATLGSGVVVPVFDPTDTVLHLAFHAAQAGGARLMWLGDLYYAASMEGFDINELAARARRARVEVPVAVVLDRVDRVLGLPGGLGPFERFLAGAAGRLVRRRDSLVSFPGLPGDRSRAVDIASGVRRGAAASAVSMGSFLIESRRITRRVERHGPDVRLLGIDVPDAEARAGYLSRVAQFGAGRASG
jgi:hypothetical protein